jgi:hypothetical protein
MVFLWFSYDLMSKPFLITRGHMLKNHPSPTLKSANILTMAALVREISVLLSDFVRSCGWQFPVAWLKTPLLNTPTHAENIINSFWLAHNIL